MYLVFFYRSPPPPHQSLSPPSSSPLFPSLKRGLEEALCAWYPASGRLLLNPATGKLDLSCTNSGALLAEAVTQVKISELGDLSQYNDFYEKLVYKPPSSSNFFDIPLVVAQVTKMGCGGYAVGVGTNHSLFDGLANYEFLSAWASKVVGKMELTEPVHERAAASVDSIDVVGKAEVECKFAEMGSSSGQKHFFLKTFSLSSGMVELLKCKARAGLGATSCSSFEVVAAHLWKARTRALGIAKNRIVCLQFTVDTRSRMDPPLPRGFTGNAFVLSSISCTAEELEHQTLSAIVEKIKEAKRSVNDDYIRTYLEALDAPQSSLPGLPELTMVSDWSRTPYHKVDFGLGEAIYASPLVPPFQQVAYFMQSPVQAGGVDVRIGLHQKHVAAFSHYFLAAL
ncbi:Omega-hydroxypalmitate O-feruloyl transferase [Ananas comosus]|uniref:Omega-hydroxypalmitate O-feruloyl transferase n=1 Tax=Ananas comosus TaxID=4615 RepID=A0A199V750_ANACO|nr:Omega-hydroxypalmitate O-feruloyl transferase [Ananas comosus]